MMGWKMTVEISQAPCGVSAVVCYCNHCSKLYKKKLISKKLGHLIELFETTMYNRVGCDILM